MSKYLRPVAYLISFGLIARPTYHWIAHPETTQMQMFLGFWPWYLGAILVIGVGSFLKLSRG